MSSLIDQLTDCWMVDGALMSNSNFMVLVVYLVLETPRMSYMNTLFFDTRLIGLEVPDLAQPVIGSGSQPYKDY